MHFVEVVFLIGISGIIFLHFARRRSKKLIAPLILEIETLKNRVKSLETHSGPQAKSQSTQQSPKTLKSDAPKPSQPSPPSSPVNAEAPPEPSFSKSEPRIEAPPVQPEAPYESPASKLVSEAVSAVVRYFSTGNTVVKVGVILLFFGVSFLVKYASDRGILPIELRLTAAALGGLALIQFGWKLREKNKNYALVLQGGGVGILFIIIFAALKIYSLIPAALAFLMLVALAGLTAMLAVLQDSLSLAAFGITGGFLAPVLASTGQGNHVILFSYYGFLNAGIFTIAWFKAWRILNLLGFIFTFVIGTTWGILKYQPEHYASVQPFLILFFLMYVAIPILFAKRQKPELKGYVDGTLVFGNTVISFGLQAGLVKNFEYATAISALLFSFFYLVLGRILYATGGKNYRMLVEAFVALGVVFATVTIPLAFDGHWTAAVWAMEAAGIYWVSLRQNRPLGRAFSSLLIFAAGVAFMSDHQRSGFAFPILNNFYMGCLMVASGSLVTSYLMRKYRDKLTEHELWLIPTFFVYGSLWWIFGGLIEIDRNFLDWWHRSQPQDLSSTLPDFPYRYLSNFGLLYVSLGMLFFNRISRRLDWDYGKYLGFFLIFFLYHELASLEGVVHPFAFGGFMIWPLSLGIFYHILYSNESDQKLNPHFARVGHIGALWWLAITGAMELSWQVGRFVDSTTSSWESAASGLFPMLILAFFLSKKRLDQWPMKSRESDYLTWGLGPITAVLWIWFFQTNWSNDGDPFPLLYIPVLNPLEVAHGFFMILLPMWLLRLRKHQNRPFEIAPIHLGTVLGITYFFWLNGILLRAIHHYQGVPFYFDSLFSSVLVQTALSIYWSLIGISLMILSSKKKLRWLWISGACLMGVVVVKLFLIDLSKTGTVERIISFLVVGVLLLLVGYFSPIPPSGPSSREKEKSS